MLRNIISESAEELEVVGGGAGTFESFRNPGQKAKPEDLQLIQFVVGGKDTQMWSLIIELLWLG